MRTVIKYSRLILACLLAFVISSTIFTRQYLTPYQFNTMKLSEDAQTMMTAISSIHFELPQLSLISQKGEPSPMPTIPTTHSPMEFNTIPTTEPSIPTSTPIVIKPTIRAVPTVFNPKPTIRRSITPIRTVPTTRIDPTETPEPTDKPKPTKVPAIFPIDASKKRPGETVDDIIAQAAAKACVPKEFLRTIASIESGGFFDTVTPRYLLLYNSENWWNSEFIANDDEGRKRVCSGYAYDSNTGLVFSDSKHAGAVCRAGSNSGLTTAGVMHLSSYMNNKFKSKVGEKGADRRIIYDSLVMAGLMAKENTKASSCTNWDARTLVKAACGHYGSCGVKDGAYYCATFCRNITQYGGKSCAGAIAEFAETCWK